MPYLTELSFSQSISAPWLEQNEDQVLAGYAYLEDQLKHFGVDTLFRNGAMLNQAGTTCAVAFRFNAVARPNVYIDGTAPTLAAFADECEATSAFQSVAVG